MLGTFQSFPENVQRTDCFVSSVSHRRLQQAIILVFHELNTENLCLEDFGNPSIPECRVIFELGIAEVQTFNYLDVDETKRVLESIKDKPFQIMDFLCAIRYHKMHDGKVTPLRFDYYMLRFVFDKDSTKLRIFHERGPRHISPKDITTFVFYARVGAHLPKKLRPVLP